LPQAPLRRKQAGRSIIWLVDPLDSREAAAIARPARADDMLKCDADRVNGSGGLAMADEADGERRQGVGPAQGARQERLKLALRENLKRRKFQARERGKATETPSSEHETCPDGELGKRGD
jgi:hypothetical protein